MPWLLLPYATTTQALSATTAQVIHGSQPYLTFDNGVTKVTTDEGLLSIKLSDGTIITPATNTSTAANPIQLPMANQRFTDIGMLVPATTDSIALSALIGAPYNYWGDDDGDGQGTNGVTATGNLTVSITDSNGQVVSRDTILNTCGTTVPPYKLVLTSTSGSLTSQYGLPNSSSFSGGTATYYISPKGGPTICYARPNLTYGISRYAGPATIWNRTKGFLVQSTTPSSYDRNFPTTGANNLYFDLLVTGIDASTLTWPTVTKGGITATMTLNPPVDSKFNPDGASSVRVTFTGPAATASQQRSRSPGSIATPSLPQTFVLVGKDSSNNEVVRYGFVLKQWFVNRGNEYSTASDHSAWCSSFGYRLSRVKDLTNAVCSGSGVDRLYPCRGAVGATPASTVNYYQRNIGAGLFTEWGYMSNYTAAGFVEDGTYWTNDWTSYNNNGYRFDVNPYNGSVGGVNFNDALYGLRGVCAYPNP